MTMRHPGRLPRWQEWSVYLSFGLLLATGIAWLLLDNFVKVAGEFGPEQHPAQHITLIIHGTITFGFLIVGGAMVPVHIPLGWNTKRNRKTGSIVVAMLLILVATALGLYYVGDDLLRHWVSIVHWTAGLITLPLLLLHALRGPQSLSRAANRPKRPNSLFDRNRAST